MLCDVAREVDRDGWEARISSDGFVNRIEDLWLDLDPRTWLIILYSRTFRPSRRFLRGVQARRAMLRKVLEFPADPAHLDVLNDASMRIGDFVDAATLARLLRIHRHAVQVCKKGRRTKTKTR